MMWRACSREPEIAAALLAGRIPAELEAHLARCGACREAAAIASRLQAAAFADVAAARPPDPAGIWSRIEIESEIARRAELARRAARPILLFRLLGPAAGLAAAVGWLFIAGMDSVTRVAESGVASNPTVLTLACATLVAIGLAIESEVVGRLTRP